MVSLSICCFLRNTCQGPSKQKASSFIGTVFKNFVLCLLNNVHYRQAGQPKTGQGPLGLLKGQLKDDTVLINSDFLSSCKPSFFFLPMNGKGPLEQGQNKLLGAVIAGQAT